MHKAMLWLYMSFILYIYIKRWVQHCLEQAKNPFGPSANELINFLTRLYKEGKGYNTLNMAHSAVSPLSLNGDCSVGNHALVQKKFKGRVW